MLAWTLSVVVGDNLRRADPLRSHFIIVVGVGVFVTQVEEAFVAVDDFLEAARVVGEVGVEGGEAAGLVVAVGFEGEPEEEAG